MNALQTVNGTALESYADRSVVNELVQRVMRFHPAFIQGKVRNPEQTAYQVAQLAILMGASPLPGLNEIHVDDKLGVIIGINYWERRGDQKGGVYWDIESRPMTEQEREMYGIPKTQLAAICRGVPMNSIREMRAIGFNMTQAIKAGAVTGIGVVNSTEYAKNGRPLVWTAIKRAKSDFYKSAFPYIPGERLTAGAGLRQTERGYEPNFNDPMWEQELGWQARDESEHEPMTGEEIGDMNDELFGNPPARQAGPDWGVSDDGVIEGDFEPDTEEETAVTEAGEDWYTSLLKAKTIDEWAFRAYQTTEGKLMFTGAPGAKKWYKTVIGDWNKDALPASLKAFKKYADAKADGASQADALSAATKTYQDALVVVQAELI